MERVLGWGYFGQLTVPQLIGINRWFYIIIFVAAVLAMFRWFEKKGL